MCRLRVLALVSVSVSESGLLLASRSALASESVLVSAVRYLARHRGDPALALAAD
jgi:hypothetical protein